MIKSRIYLVLFIFMLLNCSRSFYQIKPSLYSPEMDSYYVEGMEIIVSPQENSILRVFGERSSYIQMVFHINIINTSDSERFDIDPKEIRVFGKKTDNDYKEFKVYTSEEYMKKIRNMQAWFLAFESLNSFYKTKDVANNWGKEDLSLRYQERLEKLNDKFQMIDNATEKSMLKRHTLFPYQGIAGNIIVKIPEDENLSRNNYSEYVLYVPVGSDKHKIVFLPISAE